MHSYILVITAILTITKATPRFTLLETFTGLTDNNGTTESCAFDFKNNRWIFFDAEPWNAEVDVLPGSYPWRALTSDPSDTENQLQTTISSDGIQIFQGTVDYSNVMGTEHKSGSSIVYADKTGSVGIFGQQSDRTGDTYPIGTAGTNGICYDETTNTIYATNPGIDFSQWTYINTNAGIWKIDLDDTIPAATRVYTGSSDTINDQNSNIKYESDGSTAYVFHPNGCAAKDGIIYFVESRTDGSGVLGMLTAGTDILSIDDSKGTISGDGIVIIGNYIIYSAWRNGNSNDGALYYLDITTDDMFMIGIEGLISPANIGVGPMNTICVPSLTTGALYFVKFNFKTMLRKLDREYTLSDGRGNSVWAFNLVFDPLRKKYAYINQNSIDSGNQPDIIEISSDWAADESGTITDKGLIGSDYNRHTVIPSRTTSGGSTTITAWYKGAAISNDILYGTDGTGMLFGMNLTTEDVIGYVDFGDYVDNFAYFRTENQQNGAAGVCIDGDNANNAYVMDSYSGKIYRVDISSIDGDGKYGTPVILYDSVFDAWIYDQNNKNQRAFYPYQCTIVDGIIYIVECDICMDYHNNEGETGALGIYKISDGSFYYNSDVLSTTASSIASSPNGIIVITPKIKVNIEEVLTGIGLYDPKVDTMLDIQYLYHEYVSWSRQIAIDYFNGVIASVEDLIEGVQGHSEMLFYQTDQFVIPTVEPTPAPSNSPTQTPSASITEASASTTKAAGKASHINLNMVIITMLLAFVINYIN